LQQPPLSQQIQALESELGTKLFTRVPRGVELTPAGEGFLEEARAVLSGVERAIARARSASMGQRGRIAIGLTTSASLHPGVTRTLRAYADSHAAVSLDIHANSAAGLTEALLREEVHLAVIRAAVARPADLVFKELARENMLVALPAGHHLVLRTASGANKPIALRALAGERLILVRRHAAPGMYGNVVEACHRAGFEPLVIAEVEQMLTSMNLVAAGVGISLVPASIREIRQEGIVYCPILDAPTLVAPLTLVYRRGEVRPFVTDFIELSQKLAGTSARSDVSVRRHNRRLRSRSSVPEIVDQHHRDHPAD